MWDLGSRMGYFTQLGANITDPKYLHTVEASWWKCQLIRSISRNAYAGGLNVNNAFIGDGFDPTEYAVIQGGPDLIKVDIETAEVYAVPEFEAVFEEYRPDIVIEVHINALESDKPILNTLRKYYSDLYISLTYQDPDGKWIPLDGNENKRYESNSIGGAYHLWASEDWDLAETKGLS